MLTILIFAVGVVMVLVLVLLAIVVIGMRQEPPSEELRVRAPSLFAALVRRMVRRMSSSRIRTLISVTANRGLLNATREEVKAIAGHTRWSK